MSAFQAINKSINPKIIQALQGCSKAVKGQEPLAY